MPDATDCISPVSDTEMSPRVLGWYVKDAARRGVKACFASPEFQFYRQSGYRPYSQKPSGKASLGS